MTWESSGATYERFSAPIADLADIDALPVVAVLADPPTPLDHAQFNETQVTAVTAARVALGAVELFAGPHRLAADLAAAARVLKVAGTFIAAPSQPPPRPRSALQEYFRVRLTELPAPQALAETIRVCADAIDDLAWAPLAGADIARELASTAELLADYCPPSASKQVDEPYSKGNERRHVVFDTLADGDVERPRRWMRRWIIAHQMHALCNVAAAASVAQALEYVATDPGELAAQRLRRATVYVRGSGAARAHALAIPSAFYRDTVRPTMLPPHSPFALSGRMHLEYRMYRVQIHRLISTLTANFDELHRSDPDLAEAREALLEADLIEAERHICLIEPLVGPSRSLVQPPESKDNAISSLRALRHRYAAAYSPFVRFPDRTVGRTSAW